MCVECVNAGDKNMTWDHWCTNCLGYYPWTHEKAPRWLIVLRKIRLLATLRFEIEIVWSATPRERGIDGDNRSHRVGWTDIQSPL
jgi:hypothetical protein